MRCDALPCALLQLAAWCVVVRHVDVLLCRFVCCYLLYCNAVAAAVLLVFCFCWRGVVGVVLLLACCGCCWRGVVLVFVVVAGLTVFCCGGLGWGGLRCVAWVARPEILA